MDTKIYTIGLGANPIINFESRFCKLEHFLSLGIQFDFGAIFSLAFLNILYDNELRFGYIYLLLGLLSLN